MNTAANKFHTLSFLFFMSAAAVASDVTPSGRGRPADYWQQEVNYAMQVELKEDLRTISGTASIEYINNSPDSLYELYFKAFPNAVQPESYADKKRRTMNDYSLANLKPEQEGALTIDMIKCRLGGEIEFDNTIATYYLDRPLPPGDTLNLELGFTTVLPDLNEMRMGLFRGVVKAAYWYPQVCVYDWKLGWVNAQYIGWGECYGDFGSFDVTITAPENQIVAATGILENESEVIPDDLRERLDIKNFTGPRNEWPELSLDPSRKKSWHFVAHNVNDFVFTTSSDFCIDTGSVNGVEVVAYPLRSSASKWLDAVRLGKESIKTFSEICYPYQWPVIRICDAFSGMEYPMLTNCGGGGPSPYFSLLIYHEIGHQWFMGQVGSNQVDRPFLDEGFTTYIEHMAIEKYNGREGNMDQFTKWYQRKFAPSLEDRNVRGFRPLFELIKNDYDKAMAFSYDRGEEYWTYRVSAYYKSAAMHYSLRSIFGDSLYSMAMHHYCDRWFFGHPYEDDFTKIFEEATSTELDNFFQQWYYGRQRLDYAYGGRSKEKEGRYWLHSIKLKNNGEFISPIDIAIIWQQGDTSFYTVPPEGMQYAKPNYVLLPVWRQFRDLNPEYEFDIRAQRDISKVVIDPHNMLADIEPLNNSSGLFPLIEIRLDNMKYDRTPLHKYALRWRPDIWYDEADGVQLGMHAHGSYLEVDDRFSLDTRVGTESARPFVDFRFSDQLPLLGKNGFTGWRILRSDRRLFISNWYEKRFQPRFTIPDYNSVRIEMNSLDLSSAQFSRFRPLPAELYEYLPEPTWDANTVYYTAVSFDHFREFRCGSFRWETTMNSGFSKEFDFYRGYLLHKERVDLALERNDKTRIELGLEYLSTTGAPPSQFVPQLSRVGAADAFIHSPLFRNPGTFPVAWSDHFYLSAARTRGYEDRDIYLLDSYSTSLDFIPPDLLPFRWFNKVPVVGKFLGKLDQSFFVDASYISMSDKAGSYPSPIGTSEMSSRGDEWELYNSAGVSLRMPPLWSDQGLRIDFPFYLSNPADNEDEFEFRLSFAWMIPVIR